MTAMRTKRESAATHGKQGCTPRCLGDVFAISGEFWDRAMVLAALKRKRRVPQPEPEQLGGEQYQVGRLMRPGKAQRVAAA